MSKTIAIVGAGPGVGLAVAERFAGEGFCVALIARNPESLDLLVARLREKHIDAAAFPADVCDRPALTQALGRAAAHFGTIDVLEYSPTPTSSTLRTPRAIDVDNEQLHLDLGVLGAVASVQAVLPAMLERKSGALLFTTAASAQYPVTFTASFGVAAGATLNYARVLYQDLQPDGIYAGIVSIAGLVVQRGEEGRPSPTGLPLVSAQDVADAHWRLYTQRDTPETFVGDSKRIAALAGYRAPPAAAPHV
jgi:NAD(P)-dependent dehydrogenase (short-subunit alcohol dehydrogenase family)